jgi:hypothetical protein
MGTHNGKNDPSEFFLESDGERNYKKKPDGSWKQGKSPAESAHHFQPGNKLGGRKKGSKNKKTLRMELIERGQYTPAEFLASVVNDEEANLSQRIRAAEAAAKYYDPALSSVEMHTDDDHEAPFNIIIGDNVTAEDVMDKLEELESVDEDDDEE